MAAKLALLPVASNWLSTGKVVVHRFGIGASRA
jgi:hypothetical protein